MFIWAYSAFSASSHLAQASVPVSALASATSDSYSGLLTAEKLTPSGGCGPDTNGTARLGTSRLTAARNTSHARDSKASVLNWAESTPCRSTSTPSWLHCAVASSIASAAPSNSVT